MGTYHMIDIGYKKPTRRIAIAQGEIILGEKAFFLLKNNQMPKGNPLTLCEITGILSAKLTANILPLCHPISIDSVKIICKIIEKSKSIMITCQVNTFSKTGAEMEALMGLNGALLCIYDVVKQIDSKLKISNIELIYKSGGKSFFIKKNKNNLNTSIKFCLISISDRAHGKIYSDISGHILNKNLISYGFNCLNKCLIPDNYNIIKNTIIKNISIYKPNIILTTGGTGINKKDITPEILKDICNKIIPGIGELIRNISSQYTKNACLSRTLAGIYKQTLIIALPGNINSISQIMPVLIKPINHAISLLSKVNNIH